jgi:hypothetical protein
VTRRGNHENPDGIKEQGITTAEITEAVMVARYMKHATVNDTVSNAFRFIAPES